MITDLIRKKSASSVLRFGDTLYFFKSAFVLFQLLPGLTEFSL